MPSAFEELQTASVGARRTSPLPNRSDLSGADEARCRINGGSLLAWLNKHGPEVLEQRLLLQPGESAPGLVFTSDITGLVAALEILGPSPEGIVYLLDDEAEDVLSRWQEDFFHSCVHFWARFRPRLPKHFKAQIAERHPIPPRAKYWIHEEGTMWGPLAGGGAEHLWMWDGKQTTLLEEAFQSWVS